ncbi:MAG: hypothetical protein ABH846_01765 [Patescibacteria group bacterium]
MEKEQKPEEIQEEIDAGDAVISWETWEFPPHERSRFWYIMVSIIGVSLIVYAVYTENFLFAIIILIMGVILFVNSLRHPDRIMVHITTLGIVLGDEFYPYQDLKDFAIVYEPPAVKLLYVDFTSMFKPLVAIPLEDVDPNAVREYLQQFIFENLERESEHLTDMVRRVYKL